MLVAIIKVPSGDFITINKHVDAYDGMDSARLVAMTADAYRKYKEARYAYIDAQEELAKLFGK